MKLNKITTALVGLGLVSAASVAQANTYIYLTGSTAAFVSLAVRAPSSPGSNAFQVPERRQRPLVML